MTQIAVDLLIFLDNATLGAGTNPLLIEAGKTHAAWPLAVFGGLAAALGAMLQLWGLRWLISSRHAWTRRFAPSEEKLKAAMERYRRASFLALVVVRATPVPDLPLKLVAAAGQYPILLYGLAVWLGALPYYFLLARIGRVFQPPLWMILAAFVVIGLVGWLETWRRRRAAKRRAVENRSPTS
ncbi:MAG TPA: VTT domain-containing protein [Candidatus Eisenbacteria bacterium]|nr:VTT domain-containing protein [Candidatus Eisenbacteria bacterium]